MIKLVGIDPGHGIETGGKRSPVKLGLPVLREYEFNRSVAWATEQALNRCGVSYLRTVADNTVARWNARLKAAHGCKLFISIHANAGGGTGIETFYSPGSDASQRLARLVNAGVVANTEMRDRGIKTANLWVTRETPKRGMVACLVECGFMDNAGDLAKLRTHDYKMACGVGIARGVCLYLGIPYTA